MTHEADAPRIPSSTQHPGNRIAGTIVEWHDEVTSTFDVAETRARAGAPHGTVVVAKRQSAGRGRLGRVWESPAGGLWMTAILRPQTASATHAPALSLVVAAALAEALEQSYALDVRLRWPNDLYVGRRKLGGLLADARWSGEHMDCCLLGIGINVNVSEEDLSDEVRARATSLRAELGRDLDVGQVLEVVLRALHETCDRFFASTPHLDIDRVRARCDTLGRPVRATLDDGSHVEGRAADIGPLGSILINTEGGRIELWSCRELVVLD